MAARELGGPRRSTVDAARAARRPAALLSAADGRERADAPRVDPRRAVSDDRRGQGAPLPRSDHAAGTARAYGPAASGSGGRSGESGHQRGDGGILPERDLLDVAVRPQSGP